MYKRVVLEQDSSREFAGQMQMLLAEQQTH